MKRLLTAIASLMFAGIAALSVPPATTAAIDSPTGGPLRAVALHQAASIIEIRIAVPGVAVALPGAVPAVRRAASPIARPPAKRAAQAVASLPCLSAFPGSPDTAQDQVVKCWLDRNYAATVTTPAVQVSCPSATCESIGPTHAIGTVVEVQGYTDSPAGRFYWLIQGGTYWLPASALSALR